MGLRALAHTTRALIRRHVVIQAVHAIAWILALTFAALALALACAPPEVVRRPTFAAHFDFAPPHVWAIGFLVLAGWLGICLAARADGAALPLFGMAIIIGLWSGLTVPSIIAGSGAVTAVVVYAAIAAISLVTGLALDHEDRT